MPSPELTDLFLSQLDRLRVFACRQAIDLRPSSLVDFHALRLILRHLTPADMSFLRASFGDVVIELDHPRESTEPSFFSHMMWVLALEGAWEQQPVVRRAEYRIGGRSFTMELDLRIAPECTYYVEDPTPALTRILSLGGGGFYDIGAHVGFHSLTAALFFEQTHSFEPTPTTASKLRRNLSLNPSLSLGVHEVALSSARRRLSFHTDTEHPGGNAVTAAPVGSEHVLQLDGRTLDEFRKEARLCDPDLIKIDVEGHEVEVLVGSRETIDEYRPMLFVEFNDERNLRRFWDLLPTEYRAYGLDSIGPCREFDDARWKRRPRDLLFADASRQAILERLR